MDMVCIKLSICPVCSGVIVMKYWNTELVEDLLGKLIMLFTFSCKKFIELKGKGALVNYYNIFLAVSSSSRNLVVGVSIDFVT